MIYSVALTLLLGFELLYYLLIVQTGLTESFHSDLVALAPLFVGGVIGSGVSGMPWGSVVKVPHKLIIALSGQLILSFWYPDYAPWMLFMLGLLVGAIAPLAIYLFTPKTRHDLIIALGIAYTVGTYDFTTNPMTRDIYAELFSAIALVMALLLRHYQVEKEQVLKTPPLLLYAVLMLWIMLDSALFESLSRHTGLMIWRGEYTNTIIVTHLIGLLLASMIKIRESIQHIVIALLFAASYTISYLEIAWLLAVVYPITISYYNVTVFRHLSIVDSPLKLGLLMVFIGWLASGAGLGVALSHLIH